jgi:hypothetical protein
MNRLPLRVLLITMMLAIAAHAQPSDEQDGRLLSLAGHWQGEYRSGGERLPCAMEAAFVLDGAWLELRLTVYRDPARKSTLLEERALLRADDDERMSLSLFDSRRSSKWGTVTTKGTVWRLALQTSAGRKETGTWSWASPDDFHLVMTQTPAGSEAPLVTEIIMRRANGK